MVGTVAVVVLARWRDDARLWGVWRLVRQRAPLRGTPGLGFAKVLGSGRDGGFGMAPGLQHHGLFLVFDGEANARRFVDTSPLLAAYREHAAECATAVLRATSSRGSWSGAAMDVTAEVPTQGPVAALTRASIRPRHAAEFWRHSPAAQDALARSPGCHLAVGLGEAPLLRQATFSLWSGVDAMTAYARHGAHGQAARASVGGGWFSETMFVRFAPLALAGHWKGCDLGTL
jgi:spheroidene monooxygenase